MKTIEYLKSTKLYEEVQIAKPKPKAKKGMLKTNYINTKKAEDINPDELDEYKEKEKKKPKGTLKGAIKKMYRSCEHDDEHSHSEEEKSKPDPTKEKGYYINLLKGVFRETG